MEQSQVAAAIKVLQAAGKAASIQNIHRTLGFGSKRDVVRHKCALLGEGERDTMPETETVTDNGLEPWQRGRRGLPPGEDIRPRTQTAPAAPPPPAPLPAPVATSTSARDPVEVAQAQLDDAAQALDAARDLMDAAVQHLASSSGVLYQGRRLGAYLANDPIKDDLLARAIHADDTYRQCMQRWEAARDQVAYVVRQHRRTRQERHVAIYAPELLQQRDHWQYQVIHATSDCMYAEAKKNL
jgi:hypothetical protein